MGINAVLSIEDIFASKKIDDAWSFVEYKPSQTGKWTNNYHRYPAKFIPQLVEKLMEEYIGADEALINDPFMGSGTTLVSGIAKGYKVSGTDINKISHLLSKVKTTPIEPDYLANKVYQFYDKVLLSSQLEATIPQRHLERIDYWFVEENKIKLGQIFTLIHQEEDEQIRDFLLIAFSNILKNCSIWLQKSNKPTRDLKKKVQNPYIILKRQLNKMLRGNLAFWKILPKKVKENPTSFVNLQCGDARKQLAADNTVDMVITSSPYVTSYEYADLHQLSTIWFDFAESLTDYRKAFIGTTYKSTESTVLNSKIAQDIVDNMAVKSKKKAVETAVFFKDMETVIQESYRILKKGGRACYVIGNTKLKGVDILNAEAFTEIMLYTGFSLDRIIKRCIPSKSLPQTRDKETGRFAKTSQSNATAYPTEFIVIGKK